MPSEKYYALCGVLRLKEVVPDSSHTADQALRVIIAELSRRGRMSWMYAVPKSVKLALEISDGNMAPIILTRLESRLKSNSKHGALIAAGILGMQAVPVGHVTRTELLRHVFQKAFTHLRQTEFPPDFAYCSLIPDIVRRLSLEIVEPLLEDPVFGRICKTLQFHDQVRSEARKRWLCIRSDQSRVET